MSCDYIVSSVLIDSEYFVFGLLEGWDLQPSLMIFDCVLGRRCLIVCQGKVFDDV